MTHPYTGNVELPDGRLVCAPHRLEVCEQCRVDYRPLRSYPVNRPPPPLAQTSSSATAAQPSSSTTATTRRRRRRRQPRSSTREPTEEEKAQVEELIRELSLDDVPQKGTRHVFPNKFVPPYDSVTPQKLFSGRKKDTRIIRITLPRDRGTGLVYIGGACLDNGSAPPRAGWAFCHGLGPEGQYIVERGRLEMRGPYGDEGAQTSNRAELRAVIAALRSRKWKKEGFHTLVIATHSEYIVEGATTNARKWVEENWTRRAAPGSNKRTEVKNKDLWLTLLGEVEKFKDKEMKLLFWRIPRECNRIADQAA